MGYFSKNNVPEGTSSLIAEITTPIDNQLYKISDDLLTEQVVNDLDKLSIINKKDIIVIDIKTNKYAYVVPDTNYRENLDKIRKYTKSVGIELLGRFGEHEYINMDQTIIKSKNMANYLNNM
jgi:protoporphyrinogen oxidase